MFDQQDPESEPPQRGRDRRALLLLLAGGVIIVAVVLLLIWPGLNSASTAPGDAGTSAMAQPQKQATGEPSAGQKGGPGDPPIYWQTIQEQVAAGLHLSVAEVKARLQPPAGARDSLGIAPVAVQQGLATAQLRRVEIDAIQKAHAEVLVRLGYLTQQQSDEGMRNIRNWDQATLDDHITRWFLDNSVPLLLTGQKYVAAPEQDGPEVGGAPPPHKNHRAPTTPASSDPPGPGPAPGRACSGA